MDLVITIISEKHSPTLTVKMDSEESALFALHLIDVFADEVSLEDGLIVRGRTYQQKTPELTSNLRMFIENHGSRKELWQLYEIISELSDGEYYAVITQAINERDLNAIKSVIQSGDWKKTLVGNKTIEQALTGIRDSYAKK